jgi:hypothetical protein
VATTFILWFAVLAVAWITLRSLPMANHENLQAGAVIILVWGMFFFGILTIPNFIPTPINLYLDIVVTLVAVVFSAVYFGYFKKKKKEPPKAIIEPEIKMHAFFETSPPNDDLVRFDYHVKAGEKHIPVLEVQVSHGYGRPLMWATLDLRRDTFEQERTGNPVKRISLIPYEEYWFTFVAIHANSKQANMKTINPPTEVPFDNITWKTPFPEVYIRFLGMRKQIEQGWIIGFNKPPWTPLAKPPNLPVDLWPVDSPQGQAMRAKREKQAGRETSDIKYTAISKDSNMGVSITSPEEEAKKHLPQSP